MPKLTYDKVLLVDEMPLIAAGLQEILRPIYPSVQVEYAVSIFTVLSSAAYQDKSFDLVVLGSGEDHSPGSFLLAAAEIKQRFPECQIMIYTDRYEPVLIDKLGHGIIGACVHKHEATGELHRACARLIAGESYLSPMLDLLYTVYRLNR